MKNLFNQLAKHFKSHQHAVKSAISAYVHARNAYMRDNTQLETDGTPFRAFGPGPMHPLP